MNETELKLAWKLRRLLLNAGADPTSHVELEDNKYSLVRELIGQNDLVLIPSSKLQAVLKIVRKLMKGSLICVPNGSTWRTKIGMVVLCYCCAQWVMDSV